MYHTVLDRTRLCYTVLYCTVRDSTVSDKEIDILKTRDARAPNFWRLGALRHLILREVHLDQGLSDGALLLRQQRAQQLDAVQVLHVLPDLLVGHLRRGQVWGSSALMLAADIVAKGRVCRTL